jgi:hypothetical protein
MKDIKVELRTTISAEAIHAAINALSGRTSRLTISEQAVETPRALTASVARQRRVLGLRHAELVYLTATGKTRTIDVEKSIYKNNISDIEGFLAPQRRRGSWRFSLKKAILYARKNGQAEEPDSNGSLATPDQRHTFDDPHAGNY